MSASSGIPYSRSDESKVFHQLIDSFNGLPVPFFGQVSINRRCFRGTVPKVFLNLSQTEACFKKMSRIGMTQRMDGGFFPDSAFLKSRLKGLLNGSFHNRTIF